MRCCTTRARHFSVGARRLLLGLYHTSPAWSVPDAEVERLEREFPDVAIVRARSKAELRAAIPEAEILFAWAPGEELMAHASQLRWLHTPSAGVGAFLTSSLKTRDVVVTNSRGVHATSIAEHTMGMLIALARRFRSAVVEQTTTGMKRDGWYVGAGVPQELHGKTLGIFGYGAIGREVARRARAFGMRVVAMKRHPDQTAGWEPELLEALGLPAEEPQLDAVWGPDGFERLLAESDAIVVAAPLTPETEGIFGAEAFERMKRGAWFVNIARGKIAREADLIAALRAGGLGGAALDVFDTEPLPRGSELYTLDNVLLTPHISGFSSGLWPRAMALFRENLRRDGVGLPLVNRVDVERGY